MTTPKPMPPKSKMTPTKRQNNRKPQKKSSTPMKRFGFEQHSAQGVESFVTAVDKKAALDQIQHLVGSDYIQNSIREIREKTFICKGDRHGQVAEVRAYDVLDVGGICKKKHGFFPTSVVRKIIEQKEHLTSKPFAEHPGLKTLQKELNERKVSK